jgi:putative lipoic acid-binding regulatory protein
MNQSVEAQGFQFPGTFELTAFGAASDELVETVVTELVLAGVLPDRDSISTRASRDRNYLAVRIAFQVETRAAWAEAHARLRRHPAIKWTL